MTDEEKKPPGLVVGTATTWKASAHLKGRVRGILGRVRARASGVALPPAEPLPNLDPASSISPEADRALLNHTCDQEGPVRAQLGGPDLPTCSICGEPQR